MLSKHLLNQLLRDSTGFMWLATDAGVFRYDGYETVPISKLAPATQHLPATQYALALGRQGDLWMLGENGLFCYSTKHRRLTAFPLPATTTGYTTRLLEADEAHDRLWVVSNSQSVIALTLSGGAIVPGSYQHFPMAIGWVAAAADGSLWVVANNHQIIHQLVDGRRRYYQGPPGKYIFPVPDTQPQQFVSACAQYSARPNGRLHEVRRWLPATHRRFSEWDVFHPQWQLPTLQWVAGNALVRLRRQRGGTGQVVGSTVSALRFESYEGYDIPLFYHAVCDVLGDEWYFSPNLRGCYKRNLTPAVQRLTSTQGTWYSSRAILRLPDQRLLVGTYNKTLFQPASHPGAALQPWPVWERDRIVTNVLHSLLALTATQVLAANDDGFHLVDTRTHRSRLLGLSATDSLVVPGIFVRRGAAGRVWAGARTGLFWLDATHPWLHPYHSARLGQALQTMQALAPDTTGALWLATTTGLYHLVPSTGAVQRFAVGSLGRDALPTNALLSLQVAGTRVWVGTRDQGLLLVDPRRGVLRQLTTNEGLPSNTVCSLLADDDANLWLGTYGGIVRYHPKTGNLIVLTRADGVTDDECNYQSAFRDTDGSLFFGSVKGVTHIWPQRLDKRASPHRRLVVSTFISSSAQDTVIRASYPAQAPVDTLHFEVGDQAAVQVALTDYLSSETTQYWCKLRGTAAPVWHPISPARTVRLANLAQGYYTLLVKARSASGIWAANELAIPVQVHRTWWKRPTVWGPASLLLLSAIVGYGWYLRRRTHRQQLLLRGRLAHDLHDELGALLVRASMQAEMLRSEYPTNVEMATSLLQNLQSASQSMRDIVWNIDPHHNNLDSLVERLAHYLHQLTILTSRRIEFQHTEVEAGLAILPELRQHFYYIFKEAVTNSLRHAPASTRLIVSLVQNTHQLLLRVQDDGPALTTPLRPGTGLRSMRQRARALGGEVTAVARPEGGVLVELIVPLRHAGR